MKLAKLLVLLNIVIISMIIGIEINPSTSAAFCWLLGVFTGWLMSSLDF